MFSLHNDYLFIYLYIIICFFFLKKKFRTKYKTEDKESANNNLKLYIILEKLQKPIIAFLSSTIKDKEEILYW